MGDTAVKDDYCQACQKMLEEVEADYRRTAILTGYSQAASRVLEAISRVPRHLFVPDERRAWAYENKPLFIGQGQTISQPFIVALMTDLLHPEPTDTVLEVGTGSGYQAAVLAQLARHVYSEERIAGLAAQAAQRLKKLRIVNVAIRVANGSCGWQEHAPFDGIMVTAAAVRIPPALIQQLRAGGRLVIPVGLPNSPQELQLLEKDQQGRVQTRSILPVTFVPLVQGQDSDNRG